LPFFVFLFLLWSAAVLCSAAFVWPFALFFDFIGRTERSQKQKKKQKRQSKALPHSREETEKQIALFSAKRLIGKWLRTPLPNPILTVELPLARR